MLPFIYALKKSIYSKKLEKIIFINIHESNARIYSSLLYFETLYSFFKSKKDRDICILNGLLVHHSASCINPTCKLYKKNDLDEMRNLTVDCLNDWFFKMFISLKKYKGSKKEKETFMLIYCSFLQKMLNKLIMFSKSSNLKRIAKEDLWYIIVFLNSISRA